MSLVAKPTRHAGAAARARDHAPKGAVGPPALGVVYGDIGTSPL
jgi:K+ transporter